MHFTIVIDGQPPLALEKKMQVASNQLFSPSMKQGMFFKIFLFLMEFNEAVDHFPIRQHVRLDL